MYNHSQWYTDRAASLTRKFKCLYFLGKQKSIFRKKTFHDIFPRKMFMPVPSQKNKITRDVFKTLSDIYEEAF